MISVCIPVYFPKKNYLHEVLSPVVSQLSDVTGAEILIYDDSGSQTDVPLWLQEWHLESVVKYEAGSQNLGLGRAWNWCVEHSTQDIIHILHQDDLILPGFYARVLKAFREVPEAGVVYNRSLYIDASGTWLTFSIAAASTDGVLPDFNARVFELDVQCPSMVVKRSVYERWGLFDASLLYYLDREFWTRISQSEKVYYLRQPMSCFRIHDEQRSATLMQELKTVTEYEVVIERLISYYQGDDKKRIRHMMNDHLFNNLSRLIISSPREDILWSTGFRTDTLRFSKKFIQNPGLRKYLFGAYARYLFRK
jgi:glycosyltransferase involved in cell wall biosynthesis